MFDCQLLFVDGTAILLWFMELLWLANGTKLLNTVRNEITWIVLAIIYPVFCANSTESLEGIVRRCEGSKPEPATWPFFQHVPWSSHRGEDAIAGWPSPHKSWPMDLWIIRIRNSCCCDLSLGGILCKTSHRSGKPIICRSFCERETMAFPQLLVSFSPG